MQTTRERIMEAALCVFGRDGVGGATTREIAREAQVNEVTLFRHFKSKDELLKSSVLHSAARYEQVFADAALGSTSDLRRTVRGYAAAYAKKLRDNEELVRTFMGEITRHLELCRSLFIESSKTSRQRFIDYLLAAKEAGLVRVDVDPVTAADALTGMLMAGTLRRPLTESWYTPEIYVESSVEIFLRGIEA